MAKKVTAPRKQLSAQERAAIDHLTNSPSFRAAIADALREPPTPAQTKLPTQPPRGPRPPGVRQVAYRDGRLVRHYLLRIRQNVDDGGRPVYAYYSASARRFVLDRAAATRYPWSKIGEMYLRMKIELDDKALPLGLSTEPL